MFRTKFSTTGTLTPLVACVILLASASCLASLGPEGKARKPPPKEAYDACQGKAEGASVQVSLSRGDTLKAVCRPLDGTLVAVPDPSDRVDDARQGVEPGQDTRNSEGGPP